MSTETSYTNKRNFDKTPEPKPSGRSSTGGDPVFVIQKHQARRLHYDFRLEIGGTLKSWSVPKGPSTDPSRKRLAVPPEDQPLEYAGFEGVIPEGQYGAGTVMVWDTGTYKNIKKTDENGEIIPRETCYQNGQIEVFLKGRKISVSYVMVKIESDAVEGNWLLVKMNDEQADARSPHIRSRSQKWLKFKCSRGHELVIGGYTDPQGERVGLGALLLGYYKNNTLQYAGRVGTGFDDEQLKELHAKLSERERETSPFSPDDIPANGVHWITPKLVAEVGFTEWTGDGKLRHPRFLGLHTDKNPTDVHKEKP